MSPATKRHFVGQQTSKDKPYSRTIEKLYDENLDVCRTRSEGKFPVSLVLSSYFVYPTSGFPSSRCLHQTVGKSDPVLSGRKERHSSGQDPRSSPLAYAGRLDSHSVCVSVVIWVSRRPLDSFFTVMHSK